MAEVSLHPRSLSPKAYSQGGRLSQPLRAVCCGHPPRRRDIARRTNRRAVTVGGSPAGDCRLETYSATIGPDARFILLNLPAEVDQVAPAASQALHALLALVLMAGMMITDHILNPIAALIACLFMGKFRCIDMNSAYRAIHWTSLILIVGMMPFALLLEKTGGVDVVVAFINAPGGGSDHPPVSDGLRQRRVPVRRRYSGESWLISSSDKLKLGINTCWK